MYLLDSSILIKWLRKDNRALELFGIIPQAESYASEITAFEILIGARSRLQIESAKKLLAIFERIPVDSKISETAARLSQKYPQIFDRNVAHTLFDAFITATAVVNGLEIITLNIRHFTILKEPGLRMKILSEKATSWI